MKKEEFELLKQKAKEEYKKCSGPHAVDNTGEAISGPVYFIKKYVKIQHPIKGTIKFSLYPFQEDVLKDFFNNKFNIILKSRQMGISTLVAAYSLWIMLFHKDKNILVVSLKQDVAKEIISKVRFANDNLPTWLRVVCIEDNKLSLKYKNGSQIRATSTTANSGVSLGLSLLIIDECLCRFSTINIRNKTTNEIKCICIGDLYDTIISDCDKNYKKINEWEVLTPSGWSNFDGVNKIIKKSYIRIVFDDNTELKCSENHKLKLNNNNFIYANEIKRGMILLGKDDKNKTVISKRKINKKIDLYDLNNVEKDQEFFSNDVISHNCALIEGAQELWTSAQPTLSTGGDAILLSTPRGIGNFFHKTWVGAEEKRNGFHPIKLMWNLHPDRDQIWRDVEGNKMGSPKEAAQEYDCDFLTSGNSVIDLLTLQWYKENKKREPLECRGVDRALWIWEYPDYTKTYIIAADIARGDGGDNSAFHVLDAETLNQCAEFKGQIDLISFGHMLVAVATEYNKALLIIENTGVGYGTIQTVIDSQYPNLFYSSLDLQYVELQSQMSTKYYSEERRMRPGFSTTTRNRPLIIARLEQYFRDKSVNIFSIRTLGELETFIWDKGKAQAMEGYHDDLCIALGIALWVRDTALRLRLESQEYTKNIIGGIGRSEYTGSSPIFSSKTNTRAQDAWSMQVGNGNKAENLTWLL